MYWIILNVGYLIIIKGQLRKGKTFFSYPLSHGASLETYILKFDRYTVRDIADLDYFGNIQK